MNDRDAQLIVEQGIRYAELREILRGDFDPDAQSKMIPTYTKGQTHFFLSGCIGNRNGRVSTRTHSALVARMILGEFAPDL